MPDGRRVQLGISDADDNYRVGLEKAPGLDCRIHLMDEETKVPYGDPPSRIISPSAIIWCTYSVGCSITVFSFFVIVERKSRRFGRIRERNFIE
jgi:hypothetical protein